MSEYYDELAEAGDDVQWAGWRRRVEQALRFEVVLDAVERVGARTILDVGCGPGGLASYIEATGRDFDYFGVDAYDAAIRRARHRVPGYRFETLDVFDAGLDETRFDAVVAIGTLVSGEGVDSRAERIERVRRLWERLVALKNHVAVLVCLDQDYIESRPLLSLEPALVGATKEELEALGSTAHFIDDAFLESDLALFGFRGRGDASKKNEGSDAAVLVGRDVEELVEAVLDGPWGRDSSASEKAWLWVEAGYREKARELLEGLEEPVDALGRLVLARI